MRFGGREFFFQYPIFQISKPPRSKGLPPKWFKMWFFCLEQLTLLNYKRFIFMSYNVSLVGTKELSRKLGVCHEYNSILHSINGIHWQSWHSRCNYEKNCWSRFNALNLEWCFLECFFYVDLNFPAQTLLL